MIRPVVILLEADCEIALMSLSGADHDSLHADPRGFVNGNRVFCKDVNSVVLPKHPKSDQKNVTYTVTIRHWPDSTAVATCTYR
jgi:hypothetical protein